MEIEVLPLSQLRVVTENVRRYSIRFLERSEWCEPVLRKAWENLVDRSAHRVFVYESPQFFDYLLATQDHANLDLLAVHDHAETLVALIPLHASELSLDFSVGQTRLASIQCIATRVLGASLYQPLDAALYDDLFGVLHERAAKSDLIALHSVPTDSPLWRHLGQSGVVRKQYVVYAPHGPRQCHLSPLPETFDNYLSNYTAKKRHNLRRQIRLLSESGQGFLKLKCVGTREDVPFLFDALKELMTPDEIHAVFTRDMAQMLGSEGFLLCYVLLAGGRPCAAVLGVRFRDVYFLERSVHHPDFRKFSPGTSLQYLVVKDLLDRGLCRQIDFGFGEPGASYRSTNVTEERADVLLFRESTSNRARIWCHFLYQAAARSVKMIHRKLKRPAPLYLLILSFLENIEFMRDFSICLL